MATPASLLIYGKDQSLLETRKLVLEAAGYRVRTAVKLSEVTRIISEERIELIILCHTLSKEDCDFALAPPHPTIKSLVLTSGNSGCHDHLLDAVLDAMDGPAKLVATVAKLVEAEGDTHSRAGVGVHS